MFEDRGGEVRGVVVVVLGGGWGGGDEGFEGGHAGAAVGDVLVGGFCCFEAEADGLTAAGKSRPVVEFVGGVSGGG